MAQGDELALHRKPPPVLAEMMNVMDGRALAN